MGLYLVDHGERVGIGAGEVVDDGAGERNVGGGEVDVYRAPLRALYFKLRGGVGGVRGVCDGEKN